MRSRFKVNFFILIAVVFMLSTTSCRQLFELHSLSKCQFKLKNIENVRVAGMNVSNITDFSDIGFMEITKLTTAFASGNFPVHFTANIAVNNPNNLKAAINRMEWIARIDDTEIARSVVERRFEIPAGGANGIIPIQIRANLTETLSGKSMKSLMNIVLSMAGDKNAQSSLTLQIKPSLRIGNKLINYPGYINLTKDFKAN